MKKRTRNPDDSRERILQAAAELFAQRGYAGVGVDEVASRSGIAKTALYYHFGNKDGLLVAVLERTAAAWIDGIRQASSAGAEPFDRLDRALAGMRTLLEEKLGLLLATSGRHGLDQLEEDVCGAQGTEAADDAQTAGGVLCGHELLLKVCRVSG